MENRLVDTAEEGQGGKNWENSIETYTANLRIEIKNFITRDVNEALLFKMKLLENKKFLRIYNIREDRNILYILIAPDEKINDSLEGKITKEAILKVIVNLLKKRTYLNYFNMKNLCAK